MPEIVIRYHVVKPQNKHIIFTLNPEASNKFKKLLSIRNIQKVYEKEISWKEIRGIDRLSIWQFEKIKKLLFKIILILVLFTWVETNLPMVYPSSMVGKTGVLQG